jgi:hypothetical protein
MSLAQGHLWRLAREAVVGVELLRGVDFILASSSANRLAHLFVTYFHSTYCKGPRRANNSFLLAPVARREGVQPGAGVADFRFAVAVLSKTKFDYRYAQRRFSVVGEEEPCSSLGVLLAKLEPDEALMAKIATAGTGERINTSVGKKKPMLTYLSSVRFIAWSIRKRCSLLIY